MKFKSKSIVAALLVSSLLLGACTDKKEKTEEETKTENISVQNEVFSEFMNEFLGLLEEGKILDAEKKMKEFLSKEKLDIDNQSTVIDAFIYGLSLKSKELNENITDFNVEIKKYLTEQKNFVTQSHVDTIENKEFKEFSQEVYDNYLLVEPSDSDNFQVTPDLNYVLSEYEKNMNEYLINYLAMYIEISTPIIYDDSITLLIKGIEGNINTMQSYLDSFQEINVEEDNLYEFYQSKTAVDLLGHYEIYFGLIHTFFVDKNDVYLPEIISYYEKSYKETKNPVLKSKIEKFLKLLKENDNTFNDELKEEVDKFINILTDEGKFISEGNINTEKPVMNEEESVEETETKTNTETSIKNVEESKTDKE